MSDTQREAFEAWHKRRYGWFRKGAVDQNVIDDRQESFIAGMQAAQAADAGREPVADDAIDAISKALRQAWQLGQTYWRQVLHEFYSENSENRKSGETQRKFDALVDTTKTMLTVPAAINADLVEALEDVKRVFEQYPTPLAIVDTVWCVDRPETLYDCVCAALSRAKEQKS